MATAPKLSNARVGMATNQASNEATLKLALELHQDGDYRAAAALYRAMLQSNQENAQIWGLLGSACRMNGDSAEAVISLEKAVACAPHRIELKAEYAIALAEAEQHQEALDLLDGLLPALQAKDQDAAIVYAAMGDACLALNRYEEAVDYYRTGLEKEPQNATASVNLATALQRLDRLDEAIEAYETAVREEPDNLLALNNLGIALHDAGRDDDALPLLQCACALAPDDPSVRTDLAAVLHRSGHLDEAEEALNKALSCDAGFARAWSNLGNLLQDKLRLTEARMAHECALAREPSEPDFYWNYAMTLLLDGRMAEGFAAYEWRRNKPGFVKAPVTGPEWDGTSPAHQTILLYSEQGLGDSIQFSRYAKILAELEANVIVACPPALKNLLGTLGESITVVSAFKDAPPYDCHAPLMSIPHLMRGLIDEIPADTPYISVPPGTLSPLPARSTELRIGLAWAGNPEHPADRRRSMSLDMLQPLFGMENVEWISLQGGDVSTQIAEAGAPLRTLEPIQSSFDDTAAAMAELDLIITVDTAAAHLAGALGRPTWVMLPHAPDWRWQIGRTDSPWYPTLQLFRQPAPDDWDSVVSAVEDALKDYKPD